MKNFTHGFRSFLATAMSLMMMTTAAQAESITFVTKLGVGQTLSLTATASDEVTFDGLTGDFESGYLNDMTITKDTVIITGTVTVIGVTHADITYVDLSKATSLMVADFSYNNIDKILLPTSSKLINLGLSYNKLTSIDVTKSNRLMGLAVAHNDLKALNLSGCPILEVLNAQHNDIATLSFTNNRIIRQIYANYNPRLTNFDVSKLDSLELLRVDTTSVTAVDVTNNPMLITLDVEGSKVQRVDVTKNPELTSLIVNGLGLTELDIEKNNALVHLECANNKLKELTLGDCFDLQTLICYNNEIEALDLSGMTYLSDFYCYLNKIRELNVDDCVNLHNINCYYNELEALDVSNCPSLEQVICFNNNLKKLTTSANNLYLLTVACFSNQIADKEMSALADSLRTRPDFFKAKFFVVNTNDANEKNICTKENVKKIKEKGWAVYDYDLDTDTPKDYEGVSSVPSMRAAENFKVRYDASSKLVTVTGLAAGEIVSLINANGQVVRSLMVGSTAGSTTNNTLSTNGLATGIYMVFANGQSTKIVVQ